MINLQIININNIQMHISVIHYTFVPLITAFPKLDKFPSIFIMTLELKVLNAILEENGVFPLLDL